MAVFGGSRGGIVGSITNAISSGYDKAKDTVSGGVQTVTRYVDNFYQHLKEELSGVTSYFKSGYGGIRDAANSAWHKSIDAVQKPDGIFDTAISTAQAMSSAAVSKLDNMTDLVKALTSWTIGFVVGFTQGISNAVKYGIQKGLSPLQGFFHASAAGAYELMVRAVYVPVDAFNAFWSGLSNTSEALGPFAPLFIAVVIFSILAVVMWLAKVVPPWVAERAYELL